MLASLNGTRHLGLPARISAVIETAKQKNGQVLLVFDPNALKVPKIETALAGYADVNYTNCGLVRAGVGSADDGTLDRFFGPKRLENYPHHHWNVSNSRDEFVASVATVLSGLKQRLMAVGDPVMSFSSAAVPGLSVPVGR